MSSVIPKRQTTIKIVVKSSKKKGIEVVLSKYTNATSSMDEDTMSKVVASEALITKSGKPLYLKDIATSLLEGFKDYLDENLTEDDSLNIQRINIMQE